MKHVVIFLLFSLPAIAAAQEMTSRSLGNLELVMERDIALLLDAKVVTQKPKTMPGFRVQIASTTNRTEANELKTQFLRNHPDKRAYVTYQQPYFKLRVGDFEQRAEASRFMNDVYDRFPGFVVSDVINTSPDTDLAEGKP
jgi:hypothetical protein